MRLILVRHGESTWNAERRMQGQADPALSDVGRQQARDLLPLVASQDPDLVVSSDLGRARETLEILGRADAPSDPRWRESHVGDWAGRLVDELVTEDAEAYRGWLENTRTPAGGEPWDDMCARVVDAVSALRAQGAQRALVVTHGGPIRACCAALVGLPRSGLVPAPTASMTIVDLAAGRLIAFGATPNPVDPPTAGLV